MKLVSQITNAYAISAIKLFLQVWVQLTLAVAIQMEDLHKLRYQIKNTAVFNNQFIKIMNAGVIAHPLQLH